MIDAIEYEYSAKAVRDKFKARGVFYTDIKLAKVLKDYMPPDVSEVYDPTCGNGNLLSVFDDHVQKYGQELDEAQANVASERLINAHIVAGDTLEAPAFVGKYNPQNEALRHLKTKRSFFQNEAYFFLTSFPPPIFGSNTSWCSAFFVSCFSTFGAVS